ncbi:6,7-dimethyl-8-ribityllumazine synthase [Arboricoccus pini]|uniref:6,7-dimethyl-8-ribityllumazine synthase n=1 Tax=Arboricoccus pini TaxID=1963835 RepID=A0A212RJL9_9PROT|nr:6,7-dimethyl-8-ribityllumazine synthase [Arboricoccus pini]SNB72486.1 6,7-dimethyl-8-ribityllumazine synthase [Arboricoccus pini]
MNQSELVTTSHALINRLNGRIAFIQAGWHSDIVAQCRESFLERMRELGVPASAIDIVSVPGAFEIPLRAKLLSKAGQHAAVVGAALVVDGGIYRHDFVAQAVISGLMNVQLETQVPIFSAVLTPHQFHEHDAHRAFFVEHFKVKGREVADACLQTLSSMHQPMPAAA